ncbi:hypothetical protein J6590_027499 [Homalodisca vitripennis]|nr:hypothetical protein J6590_027499 [Homalodisca vitripennis]
MCERSIRRSPQLLHRIMMWKDERPPLPPHIDNLQGSRNPARFSRWFQHAQGHHYRLLSVTCEVVSARTRPPLPPPIGDLRGSRQPARFSRWFQHAQGHHYHLLSVTCEVVSARTRPPLPPPIDDLRGSRQPARFSRWFQHAQGHHYHLLSVVCVVFGGLYRSRWTELLSVDYSVLGGLCCSWWTALFSVDYAVLGGLCCSRWTALLSVDYEVHGGLRCSWWTALLSVVLVLYGLRVYSERPYTRSSHDIKGTTPRCEDHATPPRGTGPVAIKYSRERAGQKRPEPGPCEHAVRYADAAPRTPNYSYDLDLSSGDVSFSATSPSPFP